MKRKIKLQLDKKRFTWVEVEEDKIPLVQEHNREVWRTVKREVRHEAMYLPQTILEKEQCPSAVDEYIEREEKEERKEKLQKAIAKLTPRQQAMVRMIFFENKSQDKVAEKYGISKSAVSHAMERIYATLKKYLEEN